MHKIVFLAKKFYEIVFSKNFSFFLKTSIGEIIKRVENEKETHNRKYTMKTLFQSRCTTKDKTS